MRTLILLTLLLPLSIQNILNGMEKNSAKLVIGNSRQSQNNTNQAQDTNTTDNTTDYSHIVFEQWTYIPSHAKTNVDELKEEGDVCIITTTSKSYVAEGREKETEEQMFARLQREYNERLQEDRDLEDIDLNTDESLKNDKEKSIRKTISEAFSDLKDTTKTLAGMVRSKTKSVYKRLKDNQDKENRKSLLKNSTSLVKTKQRTSPFTIGNNRIEDHARLFSAIQEIGRDQSQRLKDMCKELKEKYPYDSDQLEAYTNGARIEDSKTPLELVLSMKEQYPAQAYQAAIELVKIGAHVTTDVLEYAIKEIKKNGKELYNIVISVLKKRENCAYIINDFTYNGNKIINIAANEKHDDVIIDLLSLGAEPTVGSMFYAIDNYNNNGDILKTMTTMIKLNFARLSKYIVEIAIDISRYNAVEYLVEQLEPTAFSISFALKKYKRISGQEGQLFNKIIEIIKRKKLEKIVDEKTSFSIPLSVDKKRTTPKTALERAVIDNNGPAVIKLLQLGASAAKFVNQDNKKKLAKLVLYETTLNYVPMQRLQTWLLDKENLNLPHQGLMLVIDACFNKDTVRFIGNKDVALNEFLNLGIETRSEKLDRITHLLNSARTIDEEGNTILIQAIKSRDESKILTLLQLGAHPDVKNNRGVSPRHMVEEQIERMNNTDVIDYDLPGINEIDWNKIKDRISKIKSKNTSPDNTNSSHSIDE
ncbi:hypothetical protein J120_02645 [candidate division TM6 bacterium JCVI TM6SC1]|uniref:Uncharacterized protein n=1 Tax=candidate division TM6 bacterium JCVI TM6SC1 TaxID=1306947 RepID=A0A0D2K4S5_9BACT|nr:hypothetical protein J120_02645 [candidate division TM6 bacterium JCVI TM6SC1]